MQKYIHYKKWTGLITGHTREKSNCCIKDNMPTDNIDNYMVFDGKLCKRDNIVRLPLEKKLSIIKYGKTSTVKLNIFPDKNILKIIIDKYFIESFIDAYQLDKIQFIHPILKIFVHSKKSPGLLGTLEMDLNEYFKTGKYEQDISTILSKVNVTDIVFKTHRCFEHYAYEILESDRIKIKKVDRNLINEDYHIIIKYDGKILIIQNNIRYWQEVENILNDKLVISFVDKLNHNKIEHYIPFTLMLLQTKKYLTYRIPTYCNIFDKLIKINSKQLKIKYENTSN